MAFPDAVEAGKGVGLDVETKPDVEIKTDEEPEVTRDVELEGVGALATANPPVGVPAASWNSNDEVLQHAVFASIPFSQQ